MSLHWFNTDFQIRITGQARPAIEKNLFSPQDGEIEKVLVDHGETVGVGQPLVQMRSAELAFEIEKNATELSKLEQLKQAKKIALSQISHADFDPALSAKLASELADVDFQFASLNEQKKFLQKKKQRLQLKSPIAGTVTTWKPKLSLVNKPVAWGESVLNVAQLDGPWQAVFWVPERKIGYLLERAAETKQVQLDLFLESDPTKVFPANVLSIDQTAIDHPEHGRVTRVCCEVPTDLPNLRQGAAIAADVDCGRRSIWFVWTRQLTDSLKRKFVLP